MIGHRAYGIPDFLFNGARIGADGIVDLHGFGDQKTGNDTGRKDDNHGDQAKHQRSTEIGALQFDQEPIIEGLENTGDDRCPEKWCEKRLQQVEKRKGDKPQETDKEDRLHFFRIHGVKVPDVSKFSIWRPNY
jgi:hypothetical protein